MYISNYHYMNQVGEDNVNLNYDKGGSLQNLKLLSKSQQM